MHEFLNLIWEMGRNVIKFFNQTTEKYLQYNPKQEKDNIVEGCEQWPAAAARAFRFFVALPK